MAGKKRTLGGEAPAAGTGAQPTPEINLPPAPNFSELWGKESAPVISDTHLEGVKIGGETEALREQRESLPEDPFVKESKSTKFVKGVGKLAGKGFLNPRKKISFRDQAILKHSTLLDISGQLSNKIEEYRRQIPAIKDGAPDPIYDRLQAVLEHADHHISQAASEHMRQHYGVDYLDKYPNMENKPVDGMGLSEIRKAAKAGTDVKGLISVPPIMPKGSIGFTRRAADLLQQVSAHLTTISAQGAAAARQDRRLSAPELHDTDGALQKEIRDTALSYANTIDVGHKQQNPERKEAEGSALASSSKQELARLNTPDFLSAIGEPEMAQSRAADIKSMFDMKGRSAETLAAAKKYHAGLQRKLAWGAFHRIFGKKLTANEEAQAANTSFVEPILKPIQERNRAIRGQNAYEEARVGSLRGNYPVTPVFSDMEVSDKVAKDIAARNVPLSKTTANLTEEGITARAKDAIAKATAAGDTATAEKLQGHLDSVAHHTELAERNADPSKGLFIKEGGTSILDIPTEAERSRDWDIVSEGKTTSRFGQPNVRSSADGLLGLEEGREETLSSNTVKPQTVERVVGNVIANPGDSVTEIGRRDSAEAISHPFYEKPVIYKDSSGQKRVREGKHDDKIAANLQAMRNNTTDILDKDGNKTGEKIINRNLHARLLSETNALREEHRLAKVDKVTREYNYEANPNYVGKKVFDRADEDYIAASEVPSQINSKLLSVKTAVANAHRDAAAQSLNSLTGMLVQGRTGEAATNTGIQAKVTPEEKLPSAESLRSSLPYPELPYPNLPDRKNLFRRFMATSGINPDPNEPNLVQLKDKKGNPLDYKRARKRGAVFADAALNQYAYGTKIPQTEEDFYKQEQEVAKQPVRGTATRESLRALTASAGESLRAEDKQRFEAQNAEEASARARGREAGIPESLLPMMTSPPNVRGTLPLGNKGSKALVSASGESALVPGIGVVAVPPRKKVAKKVRKGKLTAADILPQELLDYDKEPTMPTIDIRGVNKKANKNPTAMEFPDLAQSDESDAKLGRQFRGFQVGTAAQLEQQDVGNEPEFKPRSRG